MQKVVTHNGGFHTDDVFAVASFQLLLGVDNVEIIRTRDEALISSADYVVDVGGVYDHQAKRYDHHQNGAPVRENGIPYAAFGLMWQHYGEEICGSNEIATAIEEHLCQPVDAGDNGISLYELNDYRVAPYELYNVITSFRPVSNDQLDIDAGFVEAVNFARQLLERLIVLQRERLRIKSLVEEVYQASQDKSVLLFEESVDRGYLIPYEDVLAIVYPADDPDRGLLWKAGVVPTGEASFSDRAKFPAAWAGLRGSDLAEVSGLPDAVFCHKACWRFVAKSKESALKAAQSVIRTDA